MANKFRWGKRRKRRNMGAKAKALLTPGQICYPNPKDYENRPSEQDSTPQARGPISQDGNPSDSASAGGDGGTPETALFDRPQTTRSDVRLARMAIRKRWEPEAEQTHAILNKASQMALLETAPMPNVIAVAKLHLDAHRQVQSDEHHDDRLEYHDRALQLRAVAGGVNVVNIDTAGGDSRINIYLPNQDDDPDDAAIVDMVP